MSWNAMTYEGKDTVLRVVRDQAAGFFALAQEPETWTAQTACPEWEVRDIVGHIVDTTEGYFPAFDAARSRSEIAAAYGLIGMANVPRSRADRSAIFLRGRWSRGCAPTSTR